MTIPTHNHTALLLKKTFCSSLHCDDNSQISYSHILDMTSSEKSNIRRRTQDERRSSLPTTRHVDDIFEDFRRQMDNMLYSWPYSTTGWNFPILADIDREVRLPVCELCDIGDKYELQLEVPGIDKDKIDVKATKNSIEISGEQSEKTEEKRKNYVFNERTYRSFQRRIPIPEEIVPSKIDAKMNNGILQIQLPKKVPTKSEEETTKVEVK
jgi:HSP20 family protein